MGESLSIRNDSNEPQVTSVKQSGKFCVWSTTVVSRDSTLRRALHGAADLVGTWACSGLPSMNIEATSVPSVSGSHLCPSLGHYGGCWGFRHEGWTVDRACAASCRSEQPCAPLRAGGDRRTWKRNGRCRGDFTAGLCSTGDR
jgi:hypothetical protein